MSVYRIRIAGLVQGVGFRPFVYRTARALGLTGEVSNDNEGVSIVVCGAEGEVEAFAARLRSDCPAAGAIHALDVAPLPDASEADFPDFTIRPSRVLSERVTLVSPDIAVCPDCLEDMRRQPHRLDYPFTNCTHCGPRFTIIESLPYDRSATSMRTFEMCPECAREYQNVADRRFHAQPVACNRCGPRYTLLELAADGSTHVVSLPPRSLFARLGKHVAERRVVAMKGLGGYNLICDALSEEAVRELRRIKARDAKPFAVMFRSLEVAERYLMLSPEEREALSSWRRPIVVCEANPASPLSPLISGGLPTVGALLPYLPAHYLLFEETATDALVFTSGNLHDEPIIIDDAEARAKLLPLCGVMAVSDRPIANRADDSVLHVAAGKARLLRRSRGYTPAPHRSSRSTEGIVAVGPEMVNTFAVGKGSDIILSQYIGDLKNRPTELFHREAIDRFLRLFRVEPRALACDLHPDYASTRLAAAWAEQAGLPLLRIQHHHAHAVACMEEHGIEGERAALILDGTGLGTDGHIWGGELLLCSHTEFRRIDHLPYHPLPGADKAVREPWRTAVAMLDAYDIPLTSALKQHKEADITLIRRMIASQTNAPLSCGAGRLFDAVAAMLGLCQVATFQAEAPMRLEHVAKKNYVDYYDFDELNSFSVCLLLNSLAEEASAGTDVGLIAARFHASLARQLAVGAEKLICQTPNLPRELVLGGGCFQNRLLLAHLVRELQARRIRPVAPALFPAGDGGIALGQLASAAARLEFARNCHTNNYIF